MKKLIIAIVAASSLVGVTAAHAVETKVSQAPVRAVTALNAESGYLPSEVKFTSSKTRAEVKAELAAARARGERIVTDNIDY